MWLHLGSPPINSLIVFFGLFNYGTECSLNIVFFSSNVVIFLNSASSAAVLVFYLPGVCTHTDTEGKQSSEYFKKFENNTIFNEHPVLATIFAPAVMYAYFWPGIKTIETGDWTMLTCSREKCIEYAALDHCMTQYTSITVWQYHNYTYNSIIQL